MDDAPAARGRAAGTVLNSTGMHAAGNYVIVWASDKQDGDGRGVHGQRFDKSGVKLGGEFLDDTSAADQAGSKVAMNSEAGFVVIWAAVLIADPRGIVRRAPARGRGDGRARRRPCRGEGDRRPAFVWKIGKIGELV
jgi:hypothetical protein